MTGDFFLDVQYSALATVIFAALYGLCGAVISQTNTYPAAIILAVAVGLWVAIDQLEYARRCRMVAGRAGVWARRDQEGFGS